MTNVQFHIITSTETTPVCMQVDNSISETIISIGPATVAVADR